MKYGGYILKQSYYWVCKLDWWLVTQQKHNGINTLV